MNPKITFTAFFCLLAFLCFAQTAAPDSVSATTSKEEEVLVFTDEMPQYPGGLSEFQQYLMTTIKYPQAEKEAMKQGTVYVQFTVEKDGSITDVHASKEVPDAPGLTKEAIRVMSNMPKWTPGKMNGKPVRIQVTQPIKFVLDTGDKKKKRH